MANGYKFALEIARIGGLSIPVAEKLGWPMRGAGLFPQSGRGHAADRVHLNEWHAAWWFLALAAQGPKTVVDTVKRVGALPPTHPQPGDFADLYHALVGEIGIRASHIFKGEQPTGPHDAPEWRLTICLDPLSAWMEWSEDGETRRRDFAPPNSKPNHFHGVRRHTVIGRDVLDAMAALCVDSLASIAAQSKTAAQPRAAAPRRSRVRTTPPSVDARGDTGKSDYRQGRSDTRSWKCSSQTQE